MLHQESSNRISVNVFVIGNEATPESIRSKVAEAVSGINPKQSKTKKGFRWTLQQDKYLDSKEVKKLRRNLLRKKDNSLLRSRVYDWFLVELALNSGLRVMEITNLVWQDISEKNSCIQIYVRKGKFSKARTVICGDQLKEPLQAFKSWKQDNGEPLRKDAPVFYSNRTGKSMTRRALQASVKRSMSRAKLNRNYSIHCLRHTFATHLLKASSWNLRFVQQQLGHSSIATTEIYAKVMSKDGEKAMKRLYQT
ncbi:tyrosine-type recombinase/integrase [Candidatus Woesearchaeota archaeon]|nr:tyrosine-type recombinase/integrase [Candidatus Woesearchaeota archaeon]